MNLKRIGLDTSKAVFTLHGVDQDEKAVLRRNMRRADMEAFFAKLPPTHVALEACGGSHHWGRRLAALGYTVRRRSGPQIPAAAPLVRLRLPRGRGGDAHPGPGRGGAHPAQPQAP